MEGAHPRISVNPDVLVGKPVIRGTRISVEFILELLAEDWSFQDILEEYPGIVVEDIKACLAYAIDVVSTQRATSNAA